MNRREFNIGLTAVAALSPTMPRAAAAQGSFSRQDVIALAEKLAAKPYVAPPSLPEDFPKIGYDQYQDIVFNTETRPFGGPSDPFGIDLMHAGFNFPHPVDLFLVEDGRVTPIVYEPGMFSYGPWLDVTPAQGTQLFAGFRLRAPIEERGLKQEFVVFQGASYFRALGRGQNYGLSARGLAIDSGLPTPEEFPLFESFWIERPKAGDQTMTVHALLNSPRVTGAYSFRIYPGEWTLMDVEAALFPRGEIERYGIAPLTSMFLFNATNRGRFDDFRWSVHDSDGLALETRDGDWLWRPLANPPKKVEFSRLAKGKPPRGFGLQQRVREYDQYHDLEARYDKRPSLWIEPRGDWGDGWVELIELPSEFEFFDNMVAYWRPAQPLRAGLRVDYAYRMRWGPPVVEPDIATVVATRIGLTMDQKRHVFVIDLDLPAMLDGMPEEIRAEAWASSGKMGGVSGRLNRATNGYRVSFELESGDAETIDLNARLMLDGKQVSETWVYRLFQGGDG